MVGLLFLELIRESLIFFLKGLIIYTLERSEGNANEFSFNSISWNTFVLDSTLDS